jgi:hypothetical protein
MVGRGFFFSSMGLPTTTCIGVEKAIGVLHSDAPVGNEKSFRPTAQTKINIWMCIITIWSKKKDMERVTRIYPKI